MKFTTWACICTLLLVVLVLAGGCTSAPANPSQAAPAAASAGPQSTAPAGTAAPVKTANIDTTINVHFNDFACLNVQDALGKEYLYPDEKYRLSAAAPTGASNVNVNVVFLDDNDRVSLMGVKPRWDGVQKKWMYEGVVPLAQFDDITVPVDKTFTIKTQSKYYICADDRKESAVNDVMLRVPVKLQRL